MNSSSTPKWFLEIIENLGEWTVVLASLVSIIIGVLSFIPFFNLLSTDVILRLTLIALGLLMGTVVYQIRQRTSEISELREVLGLVEVKVLEGKKLFPEHLVESVHQVQNYILDTNLNEENRSVSNEKQELYRRILDERLKRGEVSYKSVEVIFTKERLERVIRRLLVYEGQDYLIRHYYSSPKAIPVLHIMSFDGQGFNFGGFYSAATAGVSDQENYIYIRHPDINLFLREYWEVLWRGATPLNPGRQINWKELEQIALHINMSVAEFQEMVTQIKNELQLNNSKRKRELKDGRKQ